MQHDYDFGIYAIKNTNNDKFYIGSTTERFARRWTYHRYDLNAQRHYNIYLQRAWDKYGAASFEFVILEIVADKADVLTIEQQWIDRFWDTGVLYNVARAAKGQYGYSLSDATKAKLSAVLRGRQLTMEQREKIARAAQSRVADPVRRDEWLASTKTPGAIAKLVAKLRGRQFSEEHKRNLALAAHKVYPGFISPSGEVYRDIPDLGSFCQAHNLLYSSMSKLGSGRIQTHRGWRRFIPS